MRTSILVAMAIVGTGIVLLSKGRRTSSRVQQEREDLGRWESEGGAAPSPALDSAVYGRR
jgi:hypothetical protein